MGDDCTTLTIIMNRWRGGAVNRPRHRCVNNFCSLRVEATERV